MAQKKDINYFSMHSLDLHEAFETLDHIFVSKDFGIVINGSPHKIPFLKEGNIYQIAEPRLVMVLNGEAYVNLNLENYQLKAGSVVLTMPDVIMEARHWSDDIKLIGIILKEDVHVQENIVLDLIPAEFDRLKRIAYILWDIANLKPFREKMVNHLLQAMVADLQDLQAATEKTANEHKSSRGHMLFLNFKKLVSLHCERERSIPFYAEQLWISPHHLSAVISKASGQSAMYWINRAVILKAKVLLNTSGMMSYEVADRLNFPSAASFNKFFKRETGQTPGDYQKSTRS